MHRTEGPDFITVGTKRLNADQDLVGGVIGTVDNAAQNNAVQEELCYVIEQVKGADYCNRSAASDEAAGWHDLYDALFTMAAIPDAGIESLGLSKITDGTMLLTGTPNSLTLSRSQILFNRFVDANDFDHGILTPTYLRLENKNGEPKDIANLTYDQLLFSEYDDTTGGDVNSSMCISARGLCYPAGPGDDTVFKNARVYKTAFTFTVSAWTDLGNNHYRTAGVAAVKELTGVPPTAKVYRASMITTQASGTTTHIHEIVDMTLSTGGTWLIVSLMVIYAAVMPDTTVTLILEYDASNIDNG